MTADIVRAALWAELHRVRWHLDSLVDRRLLRRLTPDERHRYDEVVGWEKELLVALGVACA
ncbi:MAG TPA: hypothetical protein VFE55_06165 [Acidimicrobiia bacterium]|nr:hypothetical protein [Acidimicrobiia bacterium]